MDDPLQYFKRLYGDCQQGTIVFSAKSGKSFKRLKMFDLEQPSSLEAAAKYAAGSKEVYTKFNLFSGSAILAREAKGVHGIGLTSEMVGITCFGIDIDVSSKDGKYANQEDVIFKLQNLLPCEPSLIVGSNGLYKGIHAYWILNTPLWDMEQRNRYNSIAHRWFDGVNQLMPCDPTFGLERILRPVGSSRDSGETVALIHDSGKSYDIDELTLPGWEQYMPEQRVSTETKQSSSKVVAQYLEEVKGLKDIYDVLEHFKYEDLGDGYWLRPNSTSSSKTGQIYEQNGTVGITLKSTVIGELNGQPIPQPRNWWCSFDRLWILLTYGCTDAASEHAAWVAAAKLAQKELNAKTPGWDFPIFDGELPVEKPIALMNYREVYYVDDKGKEVCTAKPLPLRKILKTMREIYGDWPLRYMGRLFIDNSKGKIKQVEKIDSASKLFAWLLDGRQVLWKGQGGDGFVTKTELYEAVLQQAREVVSIERAPHFPKQANRYYLCADPVPGDGSELNKVLDILRPSTTEDRQFLIAFFLTICWAGPAGERPAFLIRAVGIIDKLIGSGKSTLSKIGSRIGGMGQENHIAVLSDTSYETLTTWIVQDTKGSRVILADNLKGGRLGGQDIESLITASRIGGKQLYVGYAERDNFMCWVLNGNLNSFSKDLANRILAMSILPPDKYSVDVNRALESIDYEKLINDLYAIWLRPEKKLENSTRRPTWDAEILSKLEDPEALYQRIMYNISTLDGATNDEQDLVSALECRLKDTIQMLPKDEPSRDKLVEAFTKGRIFLPTRIILHWLRFEGIHCRDSKDLKALLERSGVVRLQKCPNIAYRGYLWVGANCNEAFEETKVVYSLNYLRPDNVRGSEFPEFD